MLFTLLFSSVLGQVVLQQEYTLRSCISGTPESIGLEGAFNEGLIPDSCVAVCQDQNYDLAFITGATNAKCYCGNSVPTQIDPPPLVICQSPCTDGISIGCGSNGLHNGLPAFAVYLVSFTNLFKINGDAIKTLEPKLTDPMGLLPPANYIYIGFGATIGTVVLIVSTFAWIARDRANKKYK